MPGVVKCRRGIQSAGRETQSVTRGFYESPLQISQIQLESLGDALSRDGATERGQLSAYVLAARRTGEAGTASPRSRAVVKRG